MVVIIISATAATPAASSAIASVVSMDGDGGGDDAPNGEAEVKDGGYDHDGVECDQRRLESICVISHDVFGFDAVDDGKIILELQTTAYDKSGKPQFGETRRELKDVENQEGDQRRIFAESPRAETTKGGDQIKRRAPQRHRHLL